MAECSTRDTTCTPSAPDSAREFTLKSCGAQPVKVDATCSEVASFLSPQAVKSRSPRRSRAIAVARDLHRRVRGAGMPVSNNNIDRRFNPWVTLVIALAWLGLLGYLLKDQYFPPVSDIADSLKLSHVESDD